MVKKHFWSENYFTNKFNKYIYHAYFKPNYPYLYLDVHARDTILHIQLRIITTKAHEISA